MKAECPANFQFENTRYDKISREPEGSPTWLCSSQQYKQWPATDSSRVLYIEGKPGSGKNALTKYCKDSLLKQELDAKSVIVADFLYSYRDDKLQNESLQDVSVDSV